LGRGFEVTYTRLKDGRKSKNMARYEQKTDSREFEPANPDQAPGPWAGNAGADATDIAVRLWAPKQPGSSAPLTWKTDSVLIYMIADLVGASHGRIAEESLAIMSAHFDGSRQAIVAAKRIQTSLLEFLACRPGERIGAAVLLYRPRTSDSAGFSEETIQQALRQANPGQILLAESVSERLRDVPNLPLRTVSARTTILGERQIDLTELVWTTPDRLALLQVSISDEAEPQSGDIPLVGATVMVHSPFARAGPTGEALPPVIGTGNVESRNGSETTSWQSSPLVHRAQGRPRVVEELRESSGSSIAEGFDEFAERPFFTRARILLGVVALVLAAALFAMFYRPAQISKHPIPALQDRTGATEIPEKQAPATSELESDTRQPESKTVKPENGKSAILKSQIAKPPMVKPAAKVPVVAQPQMPDKAAVDDRVQNQKDTPEKQAPYLEESGGISLKDIPALLRMAQQDAGAGSYGKARTEYRKILGLQPNNQDAKEGLHKLDLIQKDQQ
jgi:hypothetical protein